MGPTPFFKMAAESFLEKTVCFAFIEFLGSELFPVMVEKQQIVTGKNGN